MEHACKTNLTRRAFLAAACASTFAHAARRPQFEIEGVDCPPPRHDLVPRDLGVLVSFVARFLAEYGESLEADDIILSGSYTATAVDFSVGREVRADFGPLGFLSARAVPPS